MSLHAFSSNTLSLGLSGDPLLSKLKPLNPFVNLGEERYSSQASTHPQPNLPQQSQLSIQLPLLLHPPQQQQPMQRHIIRPPLFAAQRQHEQLQKMQQQQPLLQQQLARVKTAPSEAASSNRRSHSNSSLASVEKRTSPELTSLRSGSKCCTKGPGCTCTSETRGRFASLEYGRISFASTRSSTGPQLLGSRRYSSSDTHFNSSLAAAAGRPQEGGPCAPAGPNSPSLAAGMTSASFSVGGEGCSEWGAVSPDEAAISSSSSSSSCSSRGSSIFVAVRVRPLNAREKRQADPRTLSVLDENSLVVAEASAEGGPRGRRVKNRCFHFDAVLGEHAGQDEVFEKCTSPLIPQLFRGINTTVFAYGATAAGKTYTMLGNESDPGLMPRALQLLFNQGCSNRETACFSMRCCFVEIYNETIRDLLTHSKSDVCELREDPEKGVALHHVTIHELDSPQQALLLLLEGNKRRTQEATDANQTSSRSHAILQVSIFSRERGFEQQLAKLSLVDLAGSERACHTSNHGQRMTEGASINRSLLALGNVINALSQRNSSSATNPAGRFVPYRDSKLTRLLKDSLGGRCVTAMVATISPAASHQEETLNTLKYARRAKTIRNAAHTSASLSRSTRTHAYEASAVDGLRAKLRELQGQLRQQAHQPSAETRFTLLVQELHQRLNLRRRLHGAPPLSSLLENPETIPDSLTTAEASLSHLQETEAQGIAANSSALRAVSLLVEDIDALAAENVFLTEQVAALQASLRESGDRFAFLQNLAQQQHQQLPEAAAAEAAAAATAAAAAAGPVGQQFSWGPLQPQRLPPPKSSSSNSSRVAAEEGELQVLLRLKQHPRLQQQQQQGLLLQQDEDFEVPTEEQELEDNTGGCEQQQHQEQLLLQQQQQFLQQQQQQQPLALQRQAPLYTKDVMQFDEYFSPQSVAAPDGSPAAAATPAAATAAAAAAVAAAAPSDDEAAEAGLFERAMSQEAISLFNRSGVTANRLQSSADYRHNTSSAAAATAAAPTAAAAAAAAAAAVAPLHERLM